MEVSPTELSLIIGTLMDDSDYPDSYQSIAKVVSLFINRPLILPLSSISFNSTSFPRLLIYLLKNSDLGLPVEIGTKVNLGVLVSDLVFSRMVGYHSKLLNELYINYNINLLGTHCKCSVICPPSKLFLGPNICRQMIQRFLLLNEIIILDIALTIRERLLW